jgi:uncharacterized membrane protein
MVTLSPQAPSRDHGARRSPQVRFVRARRRWQTGLLQLLFTGIGVALGVLLPRIHAGATVPTSRTVEVLGAVGFGILGLVSLIYSLLFLVVQSSNTTLTPRLNLFQDDPWIWRTYAVALGLFAFSMSAFLAIGGAEKVTVAVPIFAFVVALGVIVLIRNIQAKAFTSLQVNSTVDLVQRRGEKVIDDLYLVRGAALRDSEGPSVVPEGTRAVMWPHAQTTLQQLDVAPLLREAEKTGSVVVFRARVGETLWEGGMVAEVSGGLGDDVVLASCVTGVNRTFYQDPLLAFRLLADIGLRALSPAVNDPATAVQVLLAVVGLLGRSAALDLGARAVDTRQGGTRVYLNLPGWTDFMSEGLDELLIASRTSPMVLAKAVETLSELERQCPPDRRPELARRLRWVEEALAEQPQLSRPATEA